MTIKIKHLPFYIGVAIYFTVLYNLYFLALDYSISAERLAVNIVGAIASTAFLFLMINLIIRPDLGFLAIHLIENDLDPPAPFTKHIYIFRCFLVPFSVQLFFIYNRFWPWENIISNVKTLVLIGIYLSVLIYCTFFYFIKFEPTLLFREKGRF